MSSHSIAPSQSRFRSANSSNKPSILSPDKDLLFHTSLDALVLTLRGIKISTSGAAYISRLEAREMLGVLIARLTDTLPLRKTYKPGIFDGVEATDTSSERRVMQRFLGAQDAKFEGKYVARIAQDAAVTNGVEQETRETEDGMVLLRITQKDNTSKGQGDTISVGDSSLS